MASASLQRSQQLRRGWMAAAVLAALTFALFSPVRDYEFVNLDDSMYVVHNPRVKDGLSAAGTHWAFTTFHSANWHPLTWLSLQLDASLWGMNARGFHLTNVLLHAANAALVFLALRALTGCFWRSGVAALLFAVHPLRVESVAWVTERKDVLSAFLGLLALWGYAHYARRPSVTRYLLVALPFALSLLAKPMFVTLPCLLLVLDWWPLRRARMTIERSGDPGPAPLPEPRPSGITTASAARSIKSSRNAVAGAKAVELRAISLAALTKTAEQTPAAKPSLAVALRVWVGLIAEKIPLFAVVVAISVVTYLAQVEGGAIGSLERLTSAVRIENAVLSYAIYLAKILWPVNLAVFYPHPYFAYDGSIGLAPSVIALSAILLVGITAAALALHGRAPYLLTGWLWYLGTLVPVIGLVQVGNQGYADRYTYFPQVGILLALCWGVGDLLRGRPRTALASAAAVTVVLAILTTRQLPVWQDSFHLWEHAYAVSGKCPTVLVNRGEMLQEQGDWDQAFDCYREAVQLDPYSSQIRLDLGNAWQNKQDLEKAAEEFAMACKLAPKSPGGFTNLGMVLLRKNLPHEAKKQFEIARDLGPDLPETYFNLALAEERLNNDSQAREDYEKALELRPNYARAKANLGSLLVRLGQTSQGIALLNQALDADRNSVEMHYRLAEALERMDDLEGAAVHYGEATRLNPKLAPAWLNLGFVCVRLGRDAVALDCLTRAAMLNLAALNNIQERLRAAGRNDLAGQLEKRLPPAN